jgi:hypothetical protein
MCDTSSHVFVVINIIPEGGAHGSFFVFTPLYGRYRMTLEIVGRSRDILSPRTTFWCFGWTDAQFRWADAQ